MLAGSSHTAQTRTARAFYPARAAVLFYQHRQLLWKLTLREIQGRYRGSYLGVCWSLLGPLLMLGVYAFVFSVVFQPRGLVAGASRLDFVLGLFGCMACFNLFSESVGASPGLIVNHANYVKRVVFPLEILPLARILSVLVQSAISWGLFLAATAVVRGGLSWTVLWLPVVLLPLFLITIGSAYFLSAVGVFVRDAGQIVGFVTGMLMFLSPIFYRLSDVPDPWRKLLELNPMARVIENFRIVSMEGAPPDWYGWCAGMAVGVAVLLAGLAWFGRCKRAFADVV
jgi:lipopolysaccharide transport system permease protein